MSDNGCRSIHSLPDWHRCRVANDPAGHATLAALPKSGMPLSALNLLAVRSGSFVQGTWQKGLPSAKRPRCAKAVRNAQLRRPDR